MLDNLDPPLHSILEEINFVSLITSNIIMLADYSLHDFLIVCLKELKMVSSHKEYEIAIMEFLCSTFHFNLVDGQPFHGQPFHGQIPGSYTFL